MERIFSYYTQIKTARRYNLDVSTVDALIRIRFNGPKSLTDLNTLKYAWKFVGTHARADDTSISISRSRAQHSDEPVQCEFFENEEADMLDEPVIQQKLNVGSSIPTAGIDTSNGLAGFSGTYEKNDDVEKTWNPPTLCAPASIDGDEPEPDEIEFVSSEEDDIASELEEIIREFAV